MNYSDRWAVPNGQYDVQVQVASYSYPGSPVSFGFDTYWTALYTIRNSAPFALNGLALIALRIRASNQLSGVVSNLNCVAQSILPDYDGVSTWYGQAGSWFYDYETTGSGASYGLDSSAPHTSTAQTDTRWYRNIQVAVGNGSTTAFSFNLPPTWAASAAYSVTQVIKDSNGNLQQCITAGTSGSSAPAWNTQYLGDTTDGSVTWVNVGAYTSNPIQRGSVIIAAVSSGAPPQVYPDLADGVAFDNGDPDNTGTGTLIGEGISSGSITYASGAGSVTFSSPPAAGVPVTANYAQRILTTGAGKALMITTAAGTDGATVASKSMSLRLPPRDHSTGIIPAVQFYIWGYYKASAAITQGVKVRVMFGVTEDFAIGEQLAEVDIIANGGASTSWTEFGSSTAPITVPGTGTATYPPIFGSGTQNIFMRVLLSHWVDGVGGVTLEFDDLQVLRAETNAAWLNILPNPSFDSAGQPTSNPASCFKDAFTGRANKLAIATPLTDANVDLTTLEEWHADCATNGRGCNAILDRPTTLFDALRTIAAAGRAAFAINDGLYSVVRDLQQSTPVQHFTPRNSWGFRWTKNFPMLPGALKVRYINPNQDWSSDEVVVYDDNYNPGNTTLFETLDLSNFVTDVDQAWRTGRYHLAVNRLRPTSYELFCDFENLVCTRGDLVLVEHDVISAGLGSGRIKSVTVDGSGNCTGIMTDELFTFDFGSTYVVRIRRTADGTSLYQMLNNPAPSLAATIDSSATGVWVAASLAIVGNDGAPALRASVLGPTGTSTSAAVTMPTGTEAGDLIIAQLAFHANPGTITAPVGWELVLENNDSGNTTFEAIYFKLSNGSEPGSYTFTWANSVAYLSGAVAFSNVANDQPIESSNGQSSASGTSAPTPVVAPSAPLNSLIAVFAVQNSAGTLSLANTTQLWAPATSLGAWYFTPSSVATGELTFQTAIPSTSPQPAAGDLVMFGLSGSETIQCIVSKIEPAKELSARLSLLDYAPGVFQADQGAPPPFAYGGTEQIPAPVIESVRSDDSALTTDIDGSKFGRILVYLQPAPMTGLLPGVHFSGIGVQMRNSATNQTNPRGAYSSSATYNLWDSVTYNDQEWVCFANNTTGIAPGTNVNNWGLLASGGEWISMPTQPYNNGTVVSVYPVEIGQTVDLRVRYELSDGSLSAWTEYDGHLVEGQITPPLDVTNLTATQVTLKAVKLKWTRSVSPNIREYEIRQGASWASAAVIANVRTTHFQDHDLALGTYTFWVGTIDTSGNYSASPPSVTVTIAAPQGSSTLDDLADGSARAALAASGVGNGKVIEGGLAAGAATGGAQAAWSGSQSWGASFFGPFQNGAAITTSGSGAASWQTLADLDYSAAVQLQADAGASLEATVTLIAPKYERTGGDVIVTLVVLDNVPAGIAVAAELDVSGTLAWSANYYWGSLPSGMPGGSNSNQGALPSITPGVPFTLTIPRAFGYTCEKVAFGVVAPSGAISTVGFLNLFSTQDGAAGSYHAFNEWFSALQLPLSVLDAGDLVNLYALISANAANMASSDSLAARIIDENGDVIVAPQTVLSINGSTATSNVSATNSPFHGAPAAPAAGNHTYTLQFSTGGGSGGNSASATFTAASAWGWDARA